MSPEKIDTLADIIADLLATDAAYAEMESELAAVRARRDELERELEESRDACAELERSRGRASEDLAERFEMLFGLSNWMSQAATFAEKHGAAGKHIARECRKQYSRIFEHLWGTRP